MPSLGVHATRGRGVILSIAGVMLMDAARGRTVVYFFLGSSFEPEDAGAALVAGFAVGVAAVVVAGGVVVFAVPEAAGVAVGAAGGASAGGGASGSTASVASGLAACPGYVAKGLVSPVGRRTQTTAVPLETVA